MTDQTAVVVGGSRGIGLATTHALVNRGWNVVVTGRDLDRLERALALVSDDSKVHSVAGRADDPEHQATTTSSAVERFGSIDALVYCVGSSPHVGPILDIGNRDAVRMFETNVLAALGWARSCEPHLRRSRGAIVTVASLSGVQPTRNFGMYAVTKAALLHLTRQLAMELAPAVRVNAIAPALVDTDFAAPILATAGPALAESYPLGRIGAPEDVAAAAAYLVGSESAWMTGQTLVVDGGISTRCWDASGSDAMA